MGYIINEESIQKKVKSVIIDLLEKLSGDVSIYLLFDKTFMEEHTSSSDIKSFLAPAGIIDQASFDAWIMDARNIYVRDRTQFRTWDDFEVAAAKKFAGRKKEMLDSGTWKDETFDSPDPFANIKFHINYLV